MLKKLSVVANNQFNINLLPQETPLPLTNLVKDMIENKIQVKYLTIRNEEGLNRFMNDIKPLRGWLSAKRNPIDPSKVEIRLGKKASDFIVF